MIKIIVFTIKEHELWKGLWENVKQDLLNRTLNHVNGITITSENKIAEIEKYQFGAFFKHSDGGNLDAVYLLLDNIKVFFVMQCGIYPKDTSENTNRITAILEKYATNNDKLYFAQHEKGGVIDWENDDLKKILTDKSIKYQAITFTHKPSCSIISETQTWIVSGMMHGLDNLLDLFEEKPHLHAFKILSYFFPLHLELQLKDNDKECKKVAEEILSLESDFKERMEKIKELQVKFKGKFPGNINSIYQSAGERLNYLLSYCNLIIKSEGMESIPKNMGFDDFHKHYGDIKNNLLKITYTLREIETS